MILLNTTLWLFIPLVQCHHGTENPFLKVSPEQNTQGGSVDGKRSQPNPYRDQRVEQEYFGKVKSNTPFAASIPPSGLVHGGYPPRSGRPRMSKSPWPYGPPAYRGPRPGRGYPPPRSPSPPTMVTMPQQYSSTPYIIQPEPPVQRPPPASLTTLYEPVSQADLISEQVIAPQDTFSEQGLPPQSPEAKKQRLLDSIRRLFEQRALNFDVVVSYLKSATNRDLKEYLELVQQVFEQNPSNTPELHNWLVEKAQSGQRKFSTFSSDVRAQKYVAEAPSGYWQRLTGMFGSSGPSPLVPHMDLYDVLTSEKQRELVKSNDDVVWKCFRKITDDELLDPQISSISYRVILKLLAIFPDFVDPLQCEKFMLPGMLLGQMATFREEDEQANAVWENLANTLSAKAIDAQLTGSPTESPQGILRCALRLKLKNWASEGKAEKIRTTFGPLIPIRYPGNSLLEFPKSITLTSGESILLRRMSFWEAFDFILLGAPNIIGLLSGAGGDDLEVIETILSVYSRWEIDALDKRLGEQRLDRGEVDFYSAGLNILLRSLVDHLDLSRISREGLEPSRMAISPNSLKRFIADWNADYLGENSLTKIVQSGKFDKYMLEFFKNPKNLKSAEKLFEEDDKSYRRKGRGGGERHM